MKARTILLTLATACLAYPGDAQSPKLDTGAIDATVADHMRDSEIPGVVIGVVVGDEVIYGKSYGVAEASSGAAMTPRTTFQIASVTKLFTASLLIALEQDGVLDRGDPVDAHLASAKAPRDAHGRAMGLMDLATHTSGLPVNPPNRRDRPDSPTVMDTAPRLAW